MRPPVASSHPGLTRLQAGERDAILLAQEMGADVLLIDEADGRRAALALGLHVAGTFAVLVNAGWRGFVDFEDALNRLRQTSFHATDALFQVVRERYDTGPPLGD